MFQMLLTAQLQPMQAHTHSRGETPDPVICQGQDMICAHVLNVYASIDEN